MADCGAAHGKVCAQVESHEDQLKELWSSKVAVRAFVWCMIGVGFALSLVIGWTANSSSKIVEVDRCLAVMQNDVKYIAKSVSRIERNNNGNKIRHEAEGDDTK